MDNILQIYRSLALLLKEYDRKVDTAMQEYRNRNAVPINWRNDVPQTFKEAEGILLQLMELAQEELNKKNRDSEALSEASGSEPEVEINENIASLLKDLDQSLSQAQGSDFLDIEINYQNVKISRKGKLLVKNQKQEQSTIAIKVATRLLKK